MPPVPLDSRLPKAAPRTALLLLPGALTVYLSFNGGGFFPNTVGFVAVIVAAVIILRIGVADHPFEGVSPLVGVAAGALLLYGGWTLLSALWSDSTARSLIEVNRVLLYLLVLVLFGSVRRTPGGLQWLVRGVAVAATVVGTIALITRVRPDTWPTSADIVADRLSYPLTYWNALGLLAGLGIIFCTYLTTSLQEPRVVRVLAAAPIPVLATTVLFTFSRGAIGATVIGVVVYLIVARPRGLVTGLVAAGPTTAIALKTAYDADLLATTSPTTPAAVVQGHHVASVVIACVVGAVILRAVLLAADTRLAALRLPRIPRPALLGGGAVVLLAVVAIALALHAPGKLSDQYDQFVHGTSVGNPNDFRSRLTEVGSNGRIDQWRVAIDAWKKEKVHGTGASTYALEWAQHRPTQSTVTDTHSIYAEVLGELGVVGFLLLMTALGTILVVTAIRARGRHRSLYAVLFAAGLAWAIHAGVDWDWEMPAVTLWLFAAGGLVLARSDEDRAPGPAWASLPARTVVSVLVAGAAVLPMLIFISQARLDDSLAHFAGAECPAAIDDARSASSALGARPEPHEVIAYCDLRLGKPAGAVAEMRAALKRDPHNWSYHQGLAIALAAAGRDPRPEAQEALRLNSREPTTIDTAQRLSGNNRPRWKRQARLLADAAFD